MDGLLTLKIGEFQDKLNQRLDRWESQHFASRLREKDPLLWHPEPQADITNRLGWLILPESMQEKCEDILSFSRQIQKEGFSHVLLLGMGGSSLAPEVFQKTFGNISDYPELVVLDSTHPDAIADVENKLDLASTLVLVSSKSGTTLETISLFRHFWQRVSACHEEAGLFFSAITDAGSPLEQLAKEKRFRRTFLASSDVGGRYSVFTEFGLVPAALIGLDIQKLLDKGRTALKNSFSRQGEKKSPGFILGAALGEMAQRRDKLTIWPTPSLVSFTAWLEQLLAESTGKQGKGIVPVVEEPLFPAEIYGQDRVFAGLFLAGERDPGLERRFIELEALGHPTIRIVLRENLDMGQEFFLWELATASAGAVLGIHPFNQPDVQLAKDLARSAMESSREEAPKEKGALEGIPIEEERECETAVKTFLSKVVPGDYIALQAYLPPRLEIMEALQVVRKRLLKKTGVATTLGFGPRFLHSTGQLHKGGPNTVCALQLVDEPQQDLPVPGTDYSFASLIKAQAGGDYLALQQRQRRGLRINLGKSALAGLQKLGNMVSGRE
jgi:transaldolase/glucose-6-phosphate isomerase